MLKVGLLVKLVAKANQAAEVESFLRDALPLAEQEGSTLAWFAFKSDPGTFYIFDAFPDENGRSTHLEGQIAQALKARWETLLSEPPTIAQVDILAAKRLKA